MEVEVEVVVVEVEVVVVVVVVVRKTEGGGGGEEGTEDRGRVVREVVREGREGDARHVDCEGVITPCT